MRRAVEGWELGADMNELVDARRGLLVLRYCADDEVPGCENSVHLHCGESLRRATAVLREDLEMRQRDAQTTHPYTCGPSACTHPPLMEGDYEGTLRFDSRVDPPVLIEVLHVQGADVHGQVIAWAERARDGYATRRCAEESL